MTFLIGGFRLTNFGDFRLTVFGQFNPTLTSQTVLEKHHRSMPKKTGRHDCQAVA